MNYGGGKSGVSEQQGWKCLLRHCWPLPSGLFGLLSCQPRHPDTPSTTTTTLSRKNQQIYELPVVMNGGFSAAAAATTATDGWLWAVKVLPGPRWRPLYSRQSGNRRRCPPPPSSLQVMFWGRQHNWKEPRERKTTHPVTARLLAYCCVCLCCAHIIINRCENTNTSGKHIISSF